MKTEYEGRVLEINKDEIINKLESLNAEFIGHYDQQRYVYDVIPKSLTKWIRLRTNGIKTTLTIKDVKAKTISGTEELEIEVSDFEKTNQLLEELGFKNKGFQENERIQYKLNGVEIDIDTWPMIPTFMEIEGANEASVLATLRILEINEDKLCTLDVQSIYEFYGYELEEIKDLSFKGE